MDPLKMTSAIKRLVLSKFDLDAPIPTFLICFDKGGREIPVDVVSEAHEKMKHGELEAFRPEAGVGHYAHLQMRGTSSSGTNRSANYALVAPDWSADVSVSQFANGNVAVDVKVNGVGEGAEEFLSRWA